MKSIETSGKTVELAIKNGLNELGCESSDVDIEILEMGSPGLFGMFGKLAKVRLTLKEKEDDFKIDMPVFTLDIGKTEKAPKAEKAPRAEKPAPKAEKPAPAAEKAEDETAAAEETADAPKPASRRRRRGNGEHRKEEARNAESADLEPMPEPAPVEVAPFEPVAEENWSESAKLAVEFLRTTTAQMGVNVTIELMETEENLSIRMSGDTLGVLIGRRGETLDALQYLTSLYVNKGREDYLRVSLDNENYRAKREEALRKLAVRMAQRARKSGRRVVLEPMNPYERRILHSALQDNPYVQTHSEGEDPYRRVIITLK